MCFVDLLSMLNINGFIFRGSARMMVNVVMSSVIRVLFISLFLLSFVLYLMMYFGFEFVFMMNLFLFNCFKIFLIICFIDCNVFKSFFVLLNFFRMLINSNFDVCIFVFNFYVIVCYYDNKLLVICLNMMFCIIVCVYELFFGFFVARDFILCCSNNLVYFFNVFFCGFGGGVCGVVIVFLELFFCGVCGVFFVVCVFIVLFVLLFVVIVVVILVLVFVCFLL